MMIIALTGMCGSGKSAAADYLRQSGMEGVYFGEFTMARLRELDLPSTPENERKVREDIRRQHGMGGYAVLALKKITQIMHQSDLFIDGLYSTEEYEVLEKHFPGKISLIEIYVDKDIRHGRLGERSHRPLTPDQCRQRDWTEVKNLNKGGPIALSDYKVNNNGDRATLHKNLETVLKKLKSKS